MKVHIITIFDQNYLGRAMAFRDSLYDHAPAQHVHFLCLDDSCYETAKKLAFPETTLLKVEDLKDPELLASKNNRSLPEFASTCKPALLLHILKSKTGPHDLLVFIDPDFAFYYSPEPLWKKMFEAGSITITPHRFPKEREHETFKKGVYNAGIVAFRNDSSATACLTEWRRQCIEWCYLRYENGKIADQGYMSNWVKKYPGVYELTDKGVNLANWNIKNYRIQSVNGGFTVDGETLTCYHFHGLKLYFDHHGKLHAYPVSIFHRQVYAFYMARLRHAYEKLRAIDPNWTYGTGDDPGMLRLLKQWLVNKLIRGI